MAVGLIFLGIFIWVTVLTICFEVFVKKPQSNCEHDYKIKDLEMYVYDDKIIFEIEIIYECKKCGYIKTVKKDVHYIYTPYRTKKEWVKRFYKDKIFLDKYYK